MCESLENDHGVVIPRSHRTCGDYASLSHWGAHARQAPEPESHEMHRKAARILSLRDALLAYETAVRKS